MTPITIAPEWLGRGPQEYCKLELLNFLIEKAQGVSALPSIINICKDFKKSSKSSRPTYIFNNRIIDMRKHFHKIDGIDADVKLRLMFMCRTPIEQEFLDILRKDAVAEVDDRNRIIKYDNHRGLTLSAPEPHSNSGKSREEEFSGESDDDEDDEEEHVVPEENNPSITFTTSGRMAKKRTFYDSEEFKTPTKVAKKNEVKRVVKPKTSPRTKKSEEIIKTFNDKKQIATPLKESPENKKTNKTVHFAETVSICSYEQQDKSDMSSDDMTDGEDQEKYDPKEDPFYEEPKKTVRFDSTITVFPIPKRNGSNSHGQDEEPALEENQLPQKLKKSVRFSDTVSVHLHHDSWDSSSDSGLDESDDQHNFLEDLNNGIDSALDDQLQRHATDEGEEEPEPENPAEPVDADDEMISVKDVMKLFENMIVILDSSALGSIQDKLEKDMPEIVDQNVSINSVLDAFLANLKKISGNEQQASSNNETTSLSKIYLILRAVVVTLDTPRLEAMKLKISEHLNQLQESDLNVPMEHVRGALENTLEMITL